MEQERRVLMLWTAINEMAPPGQNAMRWAVGRTSMSYRKVDWARRVRNQVAHPDGTTPVKPRDVARAVDIFEQLLTRLGGTVPADAPGDDSADGVRSAGEAAGGGAGGGKSVTEARPASQVRRPAVAFTPRKMPVPTVLLLVAGIGCTLSLYLALAGLPALVLASIAMSKVYTDYNGAMRLTRTGWRVFTMLLLTTLAGLALFYVTHAPFGL